jgi:hypothetical protein
VGLLIYLVQVDHLTSLADRRIYLDRHGLDLVDLQIYLDLRGLGLVGLQI